MKNINFKTIISVAVLAFVSLSCAKKDPIGPSIKGLYGPVVVVQPLTNSNPIPDFSTNLPVYFTAKFENTVNWTLTITGSKTGATKTISGVGSELNSDNTAWYGSADDLPSFEKENVTARLSFKSTYTDSLHTELTIVGTMKHDVKGSILISSFQKVDSRWEHDWQPITTGDGSFPKPDGNNYLTMTGTPWQGSPITPYVNYLKIKPAYADSASTTGYFKLPPEPTNVYFNVMVYATATKDTWLQIMVSEEQGVGRTLEIKPDWVGWKLVTCRYSDLKVTDAQKGITATPDKVTFVQFTLLSSSGDLAAKQTVTTSYDHAIFTIDKPYQP